MLHKMYMCCAVAILLLSTANGQGILKKIKDKAQQTTDKIIDKKIDDAVGTNSTNNNSNNSTSGTPDMSTVGRSGKPSNKSGEGLISTPPNINDNLSSA